MTAEQISRDEPSIHHQQGEESVQLGGNAAVRHLVEQLTHPKEAIRVRASFTLAELGDERATHQLIALLGDVNQPDHIRLRAANMLGKLHAEAALAALMQTIVEDFQRDLRSAAAMALRTINAGAASHLLAEQLVLARGQPRQATYIIDALALLNTRTAEQALINTLLDDDLPQAEAADALYKAKSIEALEALVTEGLHSQRQNVRARSMQSLWRLGWPGLFDHLMTFTAGDYVETYELRISAEALRHITPKEHLYQVEQTLLGMFDVWDNYVREIVIETLKQIGSEEAIIPLIDLLMGEDDWFIPHFLKDSIRFLTDQWQSTHTLDHLQPYLDDPSLVVRQAAVGAVSALSRIDARTQQKIRAILNSSYATAADNDSRLLLHAAIQALGKHSDDDDLSTLIEIAMDDLPERQAAKASAITATARLLLEQSQPQNDTTEQQREAFVQYLVDLTLNESAGLYLRECALEALGTLQVKRAGPLLENMLQSVIMTATIESEEQRVLIDRIIETLADISAEGCCQYFLSLFDQEMRYDYTQTLTLALAQLRHPDSAEQLMQQLDMFDDQWVRREIAATLGELKEERAVPQLEAAAHDSSSFVRAEVVLALGKIRAESSRPLLFDALTDFHWEVRVAALHAIALYKEPQDNDLFTQYLTAPHAELRKVAVETLHQRNIAGWRVMIETALSRETNHSACNTMAAALKEAKVS